MLPSKSMYKYFLLLILICQIAFAQEKYTLSGYIRDAQSGEELIGANLINKAQTTQGIVSNVYGFYSITLPKGNYEFIVSYIGYQSKNIQVTLDKNISLNILLSQGIEMEEVIVTSKKEDKNISSTDMGTVELKQEEIKKIPALMGEVDILKVIQLLPGVMSAGEGNSGFYVRGGGSEQNLILLDEATVYNSGHLFGFFSVFNNDAIKNTTLIKGGMPAQYGGRLSSVLDLTMKDGNDKTFNAEGGIGAISSRLTLQGPIIKEKCSFIISGRRTYAFDLAQPALNKSNFAGTNYYFYDLNAKINYRISEKDRIFISGYFGRDVFKFASARQNFALKIPWGNSTLTARWNHVFSNKLFSNTSFIYQDYNFSFKGEQDDFYFKLFSGVKDINGKLDFDYFLNEKNTFKFGANYIYHRFQPNIGSGNFGGTEIKPTDSTRFAHEAAIYLQDEMKLNKTISINGGVRVSLFSQMGPYQYLSGNDTIQYNKGAHVKTYFGVEPRLNLTFKLNKISSIKAGLTRNNQYMHLVSQSNSTLPTDLWIPSSLKLKPQIGWQYALGYFRNFAENNYETSVEIYYKDLKNQVDYSEYFVQDIALNYENAFVFGKGKAYGIEFFIKKSLGDLNGWIGYTLSRSERTFDDIKGKTFVTKFDRTHDLKIVVNYTLNKKWEFGTTFVYGTGNSTTLPISYGIIGFNIFNEYGLRNWYRLPAYHRLDIGATLHFEKKLWNKIKHELVFSVYNVYNRKNPYFLYFDVEGSLQQSETKIKAIQVSLFPIIPSVTWNFKF